jgi:hypothetical protein
MPGGHNAVPELNAESRFRRARAAIMLARDNKGGTSR